MARITNHSNLPLALVKAVENDVYSKGEADYSTTQLYQPSRIVALQKQHEDEIEIDVSDMIYALLGKIGHKLLEEAGTAKIIERRLFAEFEGKIISGQVDVVEETILEDWKYVSIYVFKQGVRKDWIAQASVNRWLCEKNGIPITAARYIAIYRDWSLMATTREPDYPRQQVQSFPVEMWNLEKTEAWIRDRVQSHENALKTLPECSEEERWQRPSKIAVMVKTRKKAVKLFDVQQWAENYIKEEGLKNAYLEPRPSDPIRCRFYCPVAAFCEQGKKLIQQYIVDTSAKSE